MVRYFLLRFFLFAGCVLVLWIAGLRAPLPNALVSMVLSSIIALVAFRSMRNNAASGLQAHIANRAARIDEHRSAEDYDEDNANEAPTGNTGAAAQQSTPSASGGTGAHRYTEE